MGNGSFSSVKWSITIGVNPGYNNKTQEYIPDDEFATACRKIAQEVEDETSVYISCVFYRSRVVYKTEWGCPEEGEFTNTLTGSCNPEFCKDIDKYIEAVEMFAKKLKEEYKQSTILLEIVPMNAMYLKD
ncbi:MAG: hypothetical protein K6E85_17010 [Lachnospiraceae bacterium]|nr:hypothetical protein [Lachnospiraceae bacterium]